MLQKILSFLSPSYLFNIRPEPLLGMRLLLALIFFILIAALGGVFSFLAQKKEFDSFQKKSLRDMRNIFFTMSILGLLYAFFAYEGAAVLSARAWLLAWAIVFVVWLYFPVRFWLKEIPRLRAEKEKKKRFEKYLS